MTDSERLGRFLRTKLNDAGRQYEKARTEFQSARLAATHDVPTDDAGRAKLVCRRYAEKRAVRLDGESRPTCFESDHPDCEGCVEDIRDGRIETW